MNYNQQPNQGQNIEKNPNGGYLNRNQYGLIGVVDVTPQLLQEIQKTGKVRIGVGQVQQRQGGGDTWESARCTLKPYTPTQRPDNQQFNQNQGYQPQQPAPQGNYNTYANSPNGQVQANQQPDLNDEIPF